MARKTAVHIKVSPLLTKGKRGPQKYSYKIALKFGAKKYEVVVPSAVVARRTLIKQIADYLDLGYPVTAEFVDAAGTGFHATYKADGSMTERTITGKVVGARCSPLPRTAAAKEARRAAGKPPKATKKKAKVKPAKKPKAEPKVKPVKVPKPPKAERKPREPKVPKKPAKKRRPGRPEKPITAQMTRKELARAASRRGIKYPRGADKATLLALLTGAPAPAPARAPSAPRPTTKPKPAAGLSPTAPRQKPFGPMLRAYMKNTGDGFDEAKVAAFLASLTRPKLDAIKREFDKPEYTIPPSRRAVFARQYAIASATTPAPGAPVPPAPIVRSIPPEGMYRSPGGTVRQIPEGYRQTPGGTVRQRTMPPLPPPELPELPPTPSSSVGTTMVPGPEHEETTRQRTPTGMRRTPGGSVRARTPAPAPESNDAAEAAALQAQLGALFGGG
jgi:hypothetical protein